MGRGKPLSETEKGQIMAFKNMGLSNRKIAGRIHRSLNVINNFAKLGENYSKKNQQVAQKNFVEEILVKFYKKFGQTNLTRLRYRPN